VLFRRRPKNVPEPDLSEDIRTLDRARAARHEQEEKLAREERDVHPRQRAVADRNDISGLLAEIFGPHGGG